MAGSSLRPASLARLVLRGCSAAFLTLLLLLIAARWLRYSGWSIGPGLDHALGETMVLESQSFLWSWAYTRFHIGTIALASVVLVVGLHRRLPGHLLERDRERWRLRPGIVALVCSAFVAYHYLFDLNPTVARVCAESLVLIAVTSHPRVAALIPPRGRLLLWALAFGYWLVGARDVADRIAVGLWGLFLVGTAHWGSGRLGAADLVLLWLAAVIPANLLPAVLPLVIPLHAGIHMGDGLAYAFCETADGKRLYATIPGCDSIEEDYAHCGDGVVAEFDPASLTRVATHRFFSPTYYGRLEMLLCLDDEVLVTVHGAVHDGRRLGMAVLSFSPTSPERFDPVYAAETGATLAYDAAHDAVLYSGEFDSRVVRYDRHTKRTDESRSPELRNDWIHPIALAPLAGSQSLDTRSIHPGRNRIYVTQWMQGRYAHAIDLTTLKVVARYDVGAGGALGLAVDPERDRLFVSSLWGLDVFDLTTDRLVARKRLGLGNRPVIVDAARNRLYVSSTVEGKVRVLDRDTLAVIGEIPVGIGSRFAELSRDGSRFFASSVAAHYWWNADGLAPSH